MTRTGEQLDLWSSRARTPGDQFRAETARTTQPLSGCPPVRRHRHSHIPVDADVERCECGEEGIIHIPF